MNRARKIKAVLRSVYRQDPDSSGQAPMDERILDDAYTTMKGAMTARPGGHRTVLWRQIMKSPYTRTAAVLGIGFAVFSVLFPTRNGIVPESVALADVQTALEAQETVFATGTRVLAVDEMPILMPPGLAPLFERPGGQTGPFVLTLVAETYMSSQGYATKVYDKNGGFLAEACIDTETGVATMLFHTAKAYIRFDVSQTYRDMMAGFTIQGIVDMMYRSGDYRKIGPKCIRDIDVVGFEVTDWHERVLDGFSPAIVRFLFNMQQATARVWIDPQTKLPIQTESDIEMKGCLCTFFKDAHVEQIDNSFEWGVEIDEAMFLPEIPEDYQELSLPSGAAIGVAASSIVLAGVAPCGILLVGRSRRARARMVP